MRAATLFFTALAFAASSLADDVPDVGVAPAGGSPDGCEQTVDGNFTINIAVPVSSKFRRETASEAAGSATVCTLKDGILKDANGRIGSIVENRQFQFDGPPPQAGAVYTGGFSVCDNTSLAIGPQAQWWRCMSGEFGNLYDTSIGDQCSEVRIVAHMIDQPSSSSSSSMASSTSTSASGSASDSSTESPTSSATTDHWSTIAPTTTAASNATISSGSPSGTGSRSASSAGSTSPVADAPNAQSSGAAVPTRVPKRETFGAVIGILGAALMI